MLRPGAILAGYRIDGVIGEGGMGVVYEATQLSLNRTVALKVVAPHLSSDGEFQDRFKREGRIQAALEHPNIATVYEAGESDEGLFLAMRLVRGPTLKDLIVSRELTPDRTLRILSQIADALDVAHEAGLVHRDVKPQNVVVTPTRRDHAYLLDFGVTKAADARTMTRVGQMIGTLDYMSPEQIRGDQPTQRSDIYSLTTVLYEALSGVVPFPKESDASVLYAHMADPPPKLTDVRPEIPPAIDEVISRGMAKEPADRYETASEVVRHAERAFGNRLRAAIAPPGPIQTPEDIGIRRAEDAVTPVSRRGIAGRAGDATPVRSETIVDPARVRAPPRVPEVPQGLSRRARVAVAAALALLAIALIGGGYVVGAATSGDAESALRSMDVAGLSFSVPSDWQRRPPTRHALTLANPVAFAAPGGGGVVAGKLAAKPPEHVLARAAVVKLGSTQGLRATFRDRKRSERVFLFPRRDGRAFGLECSGAAVRLCDGVAQTVVGTGEPFPLAAVARYVSRFSRAWRAVAGARAAGLGRLATARSPDGQALGANAVAAAYRDGARAARAGAPAQVLAPSRAAANALTRASAAFARLGAAAKAENRARYARAAAGARAADARAREAANQLTLGSLVFGRG